MYQHKEIMHYMVKVFWGHNSIVQETAKRSLLFYNLPLSSSFVRAGKNLLVFHYNKGSFQLETAVSCVFLEFMFFPVSLHCIKKVQYYENKMQNSKYR